MSGSVPVAFLLTVITRSSPLQCAVTYLNGTSGLLLSYMVSATVRRSGPCQDYRTVGKD